jgi:ABC-type transport system involved in cytochrome c biogenesis permease subunit
MLATIVDWAALGKVVVLSFAGALALTVVFTTGVLLVEANQGREASAISRTVGIAAFAVCLGLLAFGLYVLFSTK